LYYEKSFIFVAFKIYAVISKKVLFEFLFLIWMGAVPVLSSVGLIYFATSHLEFFRTFSLLDKGIFWVAAVFLMGFAFCPTTFFALFIGYLWGFESFLPFVITYSLASLIGFGLAKMMHGDAIMEFFAQKFKMASFLANVKKDSFSWVFLTRLSPIFPFAITNAMMAFIGVNWKNFWIAGTLGMLPRTLLAFWTGVEAENIQSLLNNSRDFSWQDFISLAFLVLSAAGMVWKSRR
jgi:uncharacterized membrane protein YdjX (TVP38/TMEM64 family)